MPAADKCIRTALNSVLTICLIVVYVASNFGSLLLALLRRLDWWPLVFDFVLS